jgi:hypothetical protein
LILGHRPYSERNFDWLPFTPPPLVAFSGPSLLECHSMLIMALSSLGLLKKSSSSQFIF